jgi:hypothetical protein
MLARPHSITACDRLWPGNQRAVPPGRRLRHSAGSWGATAASDMANEHGWRLGRIFDPFGHEWEIGRPLGPWPPT